jgi:hypothetical protein
MKFRTFQTICQYIAIALFVCLFGIVGGVQHESLSLVGGILLGFADLGLTTLFAYMGGMFY